MRALFRRGCAVERRERTLGTAICTGSLVKYTGTKCPFVIPRVVQTIVADDRSLQRIEAHFRVTTAPEPAQTSITRHKMATTSGYFDQTVRFT